MWENLSGKPEKKMHLCQVWGMFRTKSNSNEVY